MPRPPISDAELEEAARPVARGRSQRQVAQDLGWSPARVQRCLVSLRNQVAKAKGAQWLDTDAHSAIEIAQEWLRARQIDWSSTPTDAPSPDLKKRNKKG